MAQRGRSTHGGDHEGAPFPAEFAEELVAEVTEAVSTHLHIGPLPDPQTLGGYHSIDPQIARDIVDMAIDAQNARIQAELIPLRAEAHALRIATTCVALMPIFALVVAAFFATKGMDTAALIAGAFGMVGGGAQIIHATRAPRQARQPAPPPPRDTGGSPPRPKQPKRNKKRSKSSKRRR